ncbi:MAG TPA: hypothetical protein VJT09_09420 [Pyrinomonadaceae bacterium]|nr:hypothetical protein [Pyrinomonadaceae bacterium]
MASTKCPACGLDNYSSALVCRRCYCPLMGEFAQAMRANVPAPKRTSYRWIAGAALISLAYGVMLYCAIFLFNVIPNAMHSADTGWTDFTEEQLSSMKFWFFTLLLGGIVLIFFLFYRRRSKYDS